MTDLIPSNARVNVQGRCPACRGQSLFLGDGGYVTCARLDCPEPDAASTLLEKRPAPAPSLPQCPTCGLTPTEPHPRLPGVDRCANCKTHTPAEDAAVPPELTAEEARAEVDRLATELYRAQDAVAYVAEMCAIRERQQRASQPGGGEVSTGEVLLWLEGPKCSRVQAACTGTDGLCPAHGAHRHAPAPDGPRDETLIKYPSDADEAFSELRRLQALARSQREELLRLRTEAATADQIRADVQRERDRLAAANERTRALYADWLSTGAPPLGTSIARWWDKRLIELAAALDEPSGGTGADLPADTARHCNDPLTHPGHQFMRLDVVFNCPGNTPEPTS